MTRVVHEILSTLPNGSRVLDLGCGEGSFAPPPHLRTFHLDAKAPLERSGKLFVEAEAQHLPFRDGSFDAVIANHSLEHFEDLSGALKEVGRVVKENGAFYASVPDASTFTDILYRWIARGGGHVNAFKDPRVVANLAQEATKLPHVGTRLLLSSLSFLNRETRRGRTPIKLRLLGGGSEGSLRAYVFLSRFLDRVFGTRLSVYGWAFYFGAIPCPVETRAWGNVCVRCGSGVPLRDLRSSGLVYRRFGFLKYYRCPACGARNVLVRDPEPGKAPLRDIFPPA